MAAAEGSTCKRLNLPVVVGHRSPLIFCIAVMYTSAASAVQFGVIASRKQPKNPSCVLQHISTSLATGRKFRSILGAITGFTVVATRANRIAQFNPHQNSRHKTTIPQGQYNNLNGQELVVEGQGLVNWSLRILKDKNFHRGHQHWVTVNNDLLADK